ncbi:MAG: radical SAM protein, partial [Planctomycetes bacterium]|nr:radical SAM protein [Planctomycetota bacterium]
YRITRQCLEVCIEFGNPAAVVTKGFLVVRDADLLARLNEKAAAHVWISIPFADPSVCKLFEPQAPPPARRLEAVRRLRDAGVPVGVFVAPVIPGLTDHEIPTILEKAAEAGAQFVAHTGLRLPGSVADVFIRRLRAAMPMRADRVLNRLRDIHGGKLNDSRFGHRMRGGGAYWDTIGELFAISKKRFGFDRSPPPGGGERSEADSPADHPQLTFGFAD